MLEISLETRQKYLADGTDKQFKITIDETEYTNTNLLNGSMKLIESLNSKDTLSFASIEASTISFTFINIDKDISDLQDKIAVVEQIVNEEPIPYGTFKLTEVTRDVDLLKCSGTDNMYKFDIDVASFWNGLTFPITHRALLIALCDYVGIDYDLPSSYTNYDIAITKTIETSELSGTDLLGYLADITGSYLSIDRYGKLKLYQLSSTSVYPGDDLYPDTSLYPAQGIAQHYYPSTFADTRITVGDYQSKKIDKVIIRSSSNDIGTVVGTGTNAYIVESNFLLYGFNTSDLVSIATNILNTIKDIQIVPVDGSLLGLPYVEKGDYIEITDQQDVISRTFLLKRTLSGIKQLIDEFDIECAYERTQNTSVTKSVKVLKQKTNELYRSIDTLSSTITDVESGLQSQITQNADDITLKVTKNDVINQINVSTEGATISASKINLSGYVTISSLSTAGSTTINGSNITTGSINASLITTGSINASLITAGTLSGSRIYGGTITGTTIEVGTSSGGHLSFVSGGGIYSSGSSSYVNVSGILHCGDVVPFIDNLHPLGTSSYRWSIVYSASGVSTSSDKNLKEDIQDIDHGVDLIYQLKPIQYRMKDGGVRIHYGFAAQDVKEAMTAAGINDCAMYIDNQIKPDPTEDQQESGEFPQMLSLRYHEIIAPLVAAVQSQNERIKALEERSNANG